MSRAAAALHVTQPTLSRQIMELEAELGTKLFRRSGRAMTLTENGIYFRRRAEEIVSLADAARREFRTTDEDIVGDISIGGGETPAFSLLAEAACNLRKKHPGVHFRLFSGNGNDVAERLERGLLDFALFIAPVDVSRYDTLPLPVKDTWGVLMRAKDPLAKRARISPAMLCGKPLIISSQSQVENMLSEWMQTDIMKQNIAARGNLLYNLSRMVQQGMGYAITLDGIADTSRSSNLAFRPLFPKLTASIYLAWLKSRPLSRSAEAWLKELRKVTRH